MLFKASHCKLLLPGNNWARPRQWATEAPGSWRDRRGERWDKVAALEEDEEGEEDEIRWQLRPESDCSSWWAACWEWRHAPSISQAGGTLESFSALTNIHRGICRCPCWHLLSEVMKNFTEQGQVNKECELALLTSYVLQDKGTSTKKRHEHRKI